MIKGTFFINFYGSTIFNNLGYFAIYFLKIWSFEKKRLILYPKRHSSKNDILYKIYTNMKRIMKTALLAITMLMMCWPAAAQICSESDLNCVVAYTGEEDADSRDYITIVIDHEKRLLWHGMLIGVGDVREIVKTSIRNELDLPLLPRVLGRSYTVGTRNIGVRYTHYHLCLIKDATISENDDIIHRVLHEMVEAVDEMRNEYGKNHFWVEFNQCSDDHKQLLQEILPCVIEVGEYHSMPTPPVVENVVITVSEEEVNEKPVVKTTTTTKPAEKKTVTTKPTTKKTTSTQPTRTVTTEPEEEITESDEPWIDITVSTPSTTKKKEGTKKRTGKKTKTTKSKGKKNKTTESETISIVTTKTVKNQQTEEVIQHRRETTVKTAEEIEEEEELILWLLD